MSRRLHPTLADYLVIAVSPAMIMTLVGSLVFFLIEVLYQGQYPGRLHYVMSLFVFAAVLIGRIGIELGTSHARNYAVLLGLATLLAMGRFVQFPPSMAAYALLVNVGLVGLILWCTNKLTWDCTFIDESEDASGEGVLQTMGLDPADTGSSKSKAGEQRSRPEKEQGSRGAEEQTQRSPLPQAGEGPGVRAQSKRRPHASGVWVVYFSLAALPVFGLGQRFLPAADVDRRRYAFQLLGVYVASALGLLLTTSFLGLRRYLRQRRLQMPVTMAGAWITVGCMLVAAVLGLALLLPRPSPEYAISEVPWRATSPDRSASRYAVGKEGTHDQKTPAPAGEDRGRGEGKKPPGQQGSGTQSPEQSKGAQGAKGTSQEAKGQGPPDQSKGAAGEPGKGDPGQQQGAKQQSGKAEAGAREGEKDRQAKGETGQDRGESKGSGQDGKDQQGSSKDEKGAQKEPASGSRAKSPGATSSGQKGRGGGAAAKGKGKGKEQQSEPSRGSPSDKNAQSDAPRPSPPSASAPPPTASPLSGLPLANILKWILYVALIVVGAIWLWRSRAMLADMARDLLQMWRALWSLLLGRKAKAKEAAATEAQATAKIEVPPQLAGFADPFASGQADRWSPDELVRYSFAALEAWAREHNCPRRPEQTPYEFAEQVAARSGAMRSHSRRLADLYSQVAYAPGTLAAPSTAPLRLFWQQVKADVIATTAPTASPARGE